MPLLTLVNALAPMDAALFISFTSARDFINLRICKLSPITCKAERYYIDNLREVVRHCEFLLLHFEISHN